MDLRRFHFHVTNLWTVLLVNITNKFGDKKAKFYSEQNAKPTFSLSKKLTNGGRNWLP